MLAPQSITAAPPQPAPQPAETAGRGPAYWSGETADDRAALRVDRMQRLGQLGLDLAEHHHDLVLSGAADPKVTTTFIALSQMVRRTVALEAKLDIDADARIAQALAEREAQAAKAAAAEAGRQAAREARAGRRREKARDIVETAIQTQVDADREPERVERLYDSLHERLDDPDDTADIADRPLSLVAAEICRALDLEYDIALWAEEDWALDEAEARTPGSPFMMVRNGPDAGFGEYRAVLRPSWVATQGARAPP